MKFHIKPIKAAVGIFSLLLVGAGAGYHAGYFNSPARPSAPQASVIQPTPVAAVPSAGVAVDSDTTDTDRLEDCAGPVTNESDSKAAHDLTIDPDSK